MAETSYRIQTTPGGEDNNIIIQLDQTYDCLEILSLRIQQNNIYRTFTSDYGVLVGRVIANGGLGVPNAKISVFIPISDDDSNDPIISTIYPYTKITDVDGNGVRYNLLSPVKGIQAGTFPLKQDFIDNDTYLEIYEKYYKFTTVSNTSGDYMIFGVPVGQQIVHMDVNLSDIGQYSTTADIMVANGIPKSLFISSNGTYTFKGSNDLEQLPQITSQSISANIIPLWGDLNNNSQLGITRVDFSLDLLVSPVAYLTFAVGYDPANPHDGGYDNSGSGSWLEPGGNQDSKHIKLGDGDLETNSKRPGALRRLTANTSQTIKAYKYDQNGNELSYDPTSYQIVSNGDEINQGIYMVLLPCDNDKVITDEYGNQVLSGNDNGIGTTGTWRIEVYNNIGGGVGIFNFLLQNNNGNAEPFKIRANRVYSVKTMMFDAYSLRDDHHNIDGSGNERPIFNPGDWLNGLLYFGNCYTSKSSDYPNWLIENQTWYNVQSRIIDVTDYIDTLINDGDGYYNGAYNFKFYNPSDLPANLVSTLQGYDTQYGDSNSSYEPSTASAFSNRYVFLKGLVPGSDCFASMKNYLS